MESRGQMQRPPVALNLRRQQCVLRGDEGINGHSGNEFNCQLVFPAGNCVSNGVEFPRDVKEPGVQRRIRAGRRRNVPVGRQRFQGVENVHRIGTIGVDG